MPLTTAETRRIAVEVLESDYPTLHLVGVKAEAGSSYAEIIVTIANCHAEPCRLSLGVQRDVSESDFRTMFGQTVRRHVDAAGGG